MELLATPAAIGRGLFHWWSRLQAFGVLIVWTLRGLFGRPRHGRDVALKVAYQQIYFCGLQAVPLILLIALSVGILVALQGIALLPQLGGESLVGRMLVVVVTRELAPLLTAFVVIGRSGTAMAIELGYMQVLHEVEALRATGIDPARYLVAPRVVATMASVFSLTIFFNLVAFLGAGIAAFATGRGSQIFGNLLLAFDPVDLAVTALKAVVFGIAIALVAVSNGLAVREALTELPRATISTVVGCLVFCFAINLAISVMLS